MTTWFDAPEGIFETTAVGTVRESFSVTAAGGGGFEAVAVALAHRLQRLGVSGQHSVILEIAEPAHNRYVQCLVDEIDDVWIEAVANEFLDGGFRLDAERERALAGEYGFTAPGDDTGPNWSRHVEQPVDWARLGLFLVATLCEVYDARAHHGLRLTIFPPDRW